MYDQIEVCVRNLKALNIDIATYGAILVTEWFYLETLKTIFGNWMICLKF